ncbi:uncharacterized protein LOC128553502 [Mercenaria mercenaria]|uniref:uncharacterized protein LOC128553502 n=1 Tax=Mercenaria mercenaria TaxID=6596 RepID=UPI00234F5B6A|nr:uncharacterized protein LOC128553502 [Mercenaria mercenaria]
MQGKSKKNICKSVWVCKTFGQIVVGTKKNHLFAGVKKCKYCKKIVEQSHDCYIPKYTSPEKEEPPDVPFIFYDFECRFDTGEHIPNFCVAQRACGDCIRKPLSECCMRCDEEREVIFRGDHTLSSFCTWLFNPKHKGATAIAHNAQGYDAQFILRYLVTHGTVKPKLIMNGSKIIMMEAHGVRLIHSMSFISMPLASFPKTFGLTEMAKGWFPFRANTHEFQEYIGPYLPLEYYKPGSMKPESQEHFLKWYNEKIKNEEVFDFQKEMEKYCRSDVDILRRGCGEFRYQLMSSDQIDPFLEACTLAQACNKAWRKNSMPENSFGNISDAGYPNKTRYAIKAIRWIQGIAYKHDTKIQHALNGGEQQIGPYFVDGFDKETKTMYEFLGCWTHGCKECYPKETKNPYSMQTMETLYKNTFERFVVLQQQGYNIRYIWEYQFNNSYKIDLVYKSLIDRFYPHLEPIEPRDALFGGRTNAVHLYHEVDETTNQEIKYADIYLLYPYVCKYKEYPLGHPIILSQEQIRFDDITKYKGLIKCKVLPAQNEWMPVLPLHCNKKMVFMLCRTCAEKECTFCSHGVDDRDLVGTWTSIELAKAIDKGYQVLEIYHIWHWDHWSSQV